MTPSKTDFADFLHHWVVIRPEPPGQFTVQVVGLPELQAVGASREQAMDRVRAVLEQWQARGQLAPIAVHANGSLASWPGHDPGDPLEQEFLADLERFRQEDREAAANGDRPENQPCSSTSSTQTT